ncbi:MAG: biotin--[acetyl-CoA-carboxylase] ligase [Acidobacteriota bacterium]|jgi:BirA family biotin operon repressor/biotin-[acetyl-CoA-carboxylase] ligase|nr:biotin--[acetyl-CoA-carboxylase] ligase [Acidobacteriota bacterium]
MIKYPFILTDLAHVGSQGLAVSNEPWFQDELALCREWGFPLMINDGRVRIGYDDETLIPCWIQDETPAIAWNGLRVNGFLRLDSTNREAYDRARAGALEGTLVYSETQTAGKGRLARNWFSIAGKGIYLSLILRPVQQLKFWPILTHVAANALIYALRSIERDMNFPKTLEIDLKWPNDVLLSGKKCAGILLETLTPEKDNAAAIIGVGINVHPGSVPEDLAGEAVCLDDAAGVTIPRRRLFVRFLKYFQHGYRLFQEGRVEEILELWKGFSSMWNGAQVTLFERNQTRDAVTCGLDEIGALRVLFADGSVETVLAGDVRTRVGS